MSLHEAYLRPDMFIHVQYNMNPAAENIIHKFRTVETKNLARPQEENTKMEQAEADAKSEPWCQLPPSPISPELLYRAVPNFGRVNVKWCRFCHLYQKHWSASGMV